MTETLKPSGRAGRAGPAGPAGSAGEGPLARLLETRGGTAAAEGPFVIEHREALIYMLCEAAELEHAIMCQYLFAAFSLREGVEEGLTAAQAEVVSRWRRQVTHVATQEMLHLALVHNVLSAVGAAPHLGRPNLPQPANHYPAGVQLLLLPFGEEALAHFMYLERPEGMDLDDAAGLAATGRAIPKMADGDIVPRSQDFATVGHLYRSIEAGLARLCEKLGEPGLFVGPPDAQATQADFSWPQLIPVTDLASARAAVDAILEQGEGPRGHWRKAHFGTFVAILDEYHALLAADPGFDPVRPVMVANVRPCPHDESVPLISDRFTASCTDLFNVAYEILLQSFERYFAHTEETPAQLATLARLTLSLMFEVIRPLGNLITALPVGPEQPGRTAGPSFELFYESDYLMPHRQAAWQILEERLRETAVFAQGIRSSAAGSGSAERLAPIAPALEAMAESLAAHYPDWNGRSRWSRAVPPPSEPTVLVEVAALIARADALMAGAPDGTGELGRLLAEVHEEVRGAAEGRVDQASAARLVSSVIRPLALFGPGPTAPALTGVPAGLDSGPGQGPTGPDPDRGARPWAERIWDLARRATQMRVGRPGDPMLAEAVAAMQDLAVQAVGGHQSEQGGARRQQLCAIQAGLEPSIAVAADGPYLLTNVAALSDWLGQPVPALPQMALCRCGRSSIKPLCDGAHSEVGFSGAKDPARVLDRRDTYCGAQVTIFDNRGICQHAGYCSDRLSTVFRVRQEPFVAPSGGRMDEIIRAVRACPSGALSYAIGAAEARADVDPDRRAALQVTKDGPYRVTGAIRLVGPDGTDELRAEGSSTEHYALCRCGHSQNKPFCSGMHWYVGFADPVPGPDHTPTLFEWVGGLPVLTRMTRLFYERHVPADPLLAPVFAQMPADHPEWVAAWLAEVFGGPAFYSQLCGEEGEDGYHRMISHHMGRCLTEEQRARWVELLVQSAREAGLPDDAEFASAFRSYLEWGSRLAVENSQATSHPPQKMPMPHWDWGTAGPPGARVSALAPAPAEAGQPVALPGPDETPGFEAHIKILFRDRDRQSMRFMLDLWSYEDVVAHAATILEQLERCSMPCDAAWSPEWVEVFRRWVTAGKQP